MRFLRTALSRSFSAAESGGCNSVWSSRFQWQLGHSARRVTAPDDRQSHLEQFQSTEMAADCASDGGRRHKHADIFVGEAPPGASPPHAVGGHSALWCCCCGVARNREKVEEVGRKEENHMRTDGVRRLEVSVTETCRWPTPISRSVGADTR